MSPYPVIVVGPATVVGPHVVDPVLVASAFACLDDDMGVIAGKFQSAQHIWRQVMAEATGPVPGAVSVVCPSAWSPTRIATVREAARAVVPEARVRDRREEVRRLAAQPGGPVIEVTEDLVVLTRPGHSTVTVRRSTAAVAATVARELGEVPAVVIDVPSGIVGAPQVAAELAALLSAGGTEVITLGCADLRDSADKTGENRWARKALVLVAASAAAGLLALAVVTAAGSRSHTSQAASSAGLQSSWLVEGQVAMQIPARWTVRRIVADTGSARVQAVSPDDPARVLYLTQTRVAADMTLVDSARILRVAAEKLGPGVIVDFTGTEPVAGRSALSYREVRPGREVRWTVLLDGSVRIAIGCQGPGIVADCDTAVRSAHRVDQNSLADNGTEQASGASNQHSPRKDNHE